MQIPQEVFAVPGVLSLLPFFTTISVAIITKQVHVALLIGMLTACFFRTRYNPFLAIIRVGDEALSDSLNNADMGLLLFTFFSQFFFLVLLLFIH